MVQEFTQATPSPSPRNKRLEIGAANEGIVVGWSRARESGREDRR